MVLTAAELARLDEIVAEGLPPAPPPVPFQRGVFGLLENVGAVTLGNIFAGIQGAIGASGLAPPGSVTERIGQRPTEAFVFPSSFEAFFGFDPRQTGLARRVLGKTVPIPLDPERGVTTSLEATLEAIGGTGTVEQFVERNPVVGRAALLAAELGTDPLILIPGVAGARTLAAARGVRGFIPLSRTRAVGGVLEQLGLRAGGLEGAALRLRQSGASESAVRNFIRRSLPPPPSGLRQIIAGDDPREFFTRGRLFNRRLDPALSAFGRPVSTSAGLLRGEDLRAFDVVEEGSVRRAAEATTELPRAGPEVRAEAVAPEPLAVPAAADIPVAPAATAAPVPPLDAVIRQARLRGAIPDVEAIAQSTGVGSREALRVQRAASEFLGPRFTVLTPAQGSTFERLFDLAREQGGLISTADVQELTGLRGRAARALQRQVQTTLTARPPRLAIRPEVPAGAEVAAVNLRRAAPGTSVEQLSPNNFRVTLPNQKSVLVDTAAAIERPGGIVPGLGRPLKGGEAVAGRTVISTPEGRRLMGADALVQIRAGEGPEVFSDEFFHVADELNLFTQPERAVLQRRFAKGITDSDQITEAIADGVGRWMGQRSRNAVRPDSVLERMWQFFIGLFEDVFGPTARGTLRRFERGEIFARPVTEVAPEVAAPLARVERFAIRAPSIVEATPEILAAQKHAQGINELGEGVAARFWRTIRQFASDLLGAEAREVPFRQRWKKAMDGPIGEAWARNVTRILGDDLVFVSKAIKEMPDPIFLEALFRTLKGHAGKLRAIIKNGIPRPGTVGEFIGIKGDLVDRLTAHIPELAARRGVANTSEFAADAMDATQTYMNALRVKGEASAMDDALVGVESALRGEGGEFQRITLGRLFEKGKLAHINPDREFLALENVLALDERTGNQINDWVEWLAQRSEAWKTDRISGMNVGSGLTEVEFANKLLADYESVADILAKGAEQYQKIAIEALEYRVLKGTLARADFEAIRASKDGFYVSWQRAIEEDGFSLPIQGGDPVKAFKGSQREFQNAYASLFEMVDRQIKYGDRHEFLALFTESITDVTVGRQLEQIPFGGFAENQFIVIRNGVKEAWEFNDDIMQALRGVHVNDEFGFLSKLAALPARVTRFTVTHDPGFLVRNIIRDALDRMVKSDADAGIRGLFRRFSREELTDAAMAGLDQSVGWYGKGGKQNYQRFMASQIRRATRRGDTLLGTFDSIRDKANSLFTGSEMVGRMAEFKNQFELLVKSGRSEYQASIIAANKARDLLDFATAGTAIRKLNRYVAFLNPAIQGTRALLRFARRSPRAFMRRWATFVLGPAVATYAWNQATGNAEEYLDQPAYLRDFFYNFKLGPNTWLRIPKPFELGVFASTGERFVDAAVRVADGKDPAQAFVGNIGSLIKGLTPVDEGALAGPFRPVLEIMANFDFFRDRNIIPEYEKNLALPLRKGQKNASKVARLIGRMIPFDARNIDQLIFSFGGGVARFGVGLTKDRPITVSAILRGTGLVLPSPGFGGIATQEAQRLAQERGLSRAGVFQPVSQQLQRVFQARTSVQIDIEKRRLRRIARQAATRLKRISIRELVRRQSQ